MPKVTSFFDPSSVLYLRQAFHTGEGALYQAALP